jgi:Replication-relaxation
MRNLIETARAGRAEILNLQAEPRCWRQFGGSGGGTSTLRPDLFVSLGVDDLEWRWFCELDRDTSHLPALLTKCRRYEAYRRSGREQAEHGSFPMVCWIVPNERRAEQLRTAIDRDRHLTKGLYVVTTTEQSITALSGGTP